MNEPEKRSDPSEYKRALLAAGVLVVYCITYPPLGMVGFLHGLGLIDGLPKFLRDSPLQVEHFIGLGVVVAIVVALLPTRRLFLIGIWIFGAIAICSLGGCVMMLQKLQETIR